MSMKKKHKKTEEEGGEAWLLPYSDLMTLLLAVFIVLFAVSKVDQSKAEDLSNEFKNILTGTQNTIYNSGDSIIEQYSIDNNIDTEIENISVTSEDVNNENVNNANVNNANVNMKNDFMGTYELEKLQEMQSKLNELFKNSKLSESVSSSIENRGLVISLNNTILFDSGSAEIKPDYEDSLNKIAQIINSVDNYIRVEGHTDNRPINTAIYPSNWELSTARAARIVRYFTTKCNVTADKIEAVGYGEFRPIADNSTEEGMKKNRRIDIIVLSEKYNSMQK